MNTAFVMFSVVLLFFVMVPAIETKRLLRIILAMLLIASVSVLWHSLRGGDSLSAVVFKALIATLSALVLGYLYVRIKHYERKARTEKREESNLSE